VITILMMGGLGNQMFQYAAAKALAERHGVRLALDMGGFRDDKNRSFLLDKLNIPEAATDSFHSDAGQNGSASHFFWARWRQRADRILSIAGLPQLPAPANSYREPHFQFDRRFLTLGAETSLFGYFQSELYFSSIAQAMPRFFEPRDPLGEVARIAAARIAASALPVSIHIRRGDYTQASTASVHSLLDQNYYRKALEWMEARLGSKLFELFVFSDDLDQASQVLGFVPPERVNYVRSDPERPWEDMALMARCRHQIIANSSFSWWGAWLNRSPQKIVIAPRYWFTPAAMRDRNTCDLYPPSWILV
jgi:hypothetical protein